MILKTRQFNNKRLSLLIRSATKFYIERSIPSKYIPHLAVSIKLVDIVEDGTFEKVSTNNYAIELSKRLQLEHMLVTLAHEVVHLKQYVLKELKTHYIYGQPVDVWKGKRFRNNNYYDQPWEQEALRDEVHLYQDYISECYSLGNINKLDIMRYF